MSAAYTLLDIQSGVADIKTDDTVLQFTGRCDSKGTPIYEGDIVRYVRKNVDLRDTTCPSIVFIGAVSYSDENARFQYTHKFESGSTTTSSIEFYDQRAKENIVEVVGNIYKNPTLLDVLQNNLYKTGESA